MSKKIISGKIDKVIYRNSSSGRTILVVNREDGKTCRIIGNYCCPLNMKSQFEPIVVK